LKAGCPFVNKANKRKVMRYPFPSPNGPQRWEGLPILSGMQKKSCQCDCGEIAGCLVALSEAHLQCPRFLYFEGPLRGQVVIKSTSGFLISRMLCF